MFIITQLAVVHCYTSLITQLAVVHCYTSLITQLAVVHCYTSLITQLAVVHCYTSLITKLAVVHCYTSLIHLLLPLSLWNLILIFKNKHLKISFCEADKCMLNAEKSKTIVTFQVICEDLGDSEHRIKTPC